MYQISERFYENINSPLAYQIFLALFNFSKRFMMPKDVQTFAYEQLNTKKYNSALNIKVGSVEWEKKVTLQDQTDRHCKEKSFKPLKFRLYFKIKCLKQI